MSARMSARCRGVNAFMCYQCSDKLNSSHYYPVPDTSGGRGIVFDRFLCIFLSFFLCIFVSLLARLRENGWTDLREIFREGVE